jgi:hypothetical protein
VDKKIVASASGVPLGVGAHFAAAPWWVVVLITVLPAILTGFSNISRWFASTRPGCYIGTFLGYRFTGVPRAEARKKAEKYAFNADEPEEVEPSASPTPTEPPKRTKMVAAATPDPPPPGRARQATSAGTPATEPDLAADPDPPPDPALDRRCHLRVVPPLDRES